MSALLGYQSRDESELVASAFQSVSIVSIVTKNIEEPIKLEIIIIQFGVGLKILHVVAENFTCSG